jgi:hypothetical protein
MLRFQPKHQIEDVFMNIHNSILTKLLLCNNNVQLGMNGRSILYCTGYQAKSQQKEERHAFEQVSKVLCNVIRKQVSKICHEKSNTQHENIRLTKMTNSQKQMKQFQNTN